MGLQRELEQKLEQGLRLEQVLVMEVEQRLGLGRPRLWLVG